MKRKRKGWVHLFTQPLLFLLIFFLIGLVAKNNSLMIAIVILFILKITPLGESVFPYLRKNGINLGVTIITVAVLIPVATGEIGFKQLAEATRSYTAWIAIGSGVLVALLAKDGIKLLATEPSITAALVIGTILSVALFRGVAVGPVIGAGIAYWVLAMISFFK